MRAVQFSRSIELKPTATAYSNRCAVEFDQRTAMEAAVADCRQAAQPSARQPPQAGATWPTLWPDLGKGEEAVDAYRHALEAGVQTAGY